MTYMFFESGLKQNNSEKNCFISDLSFYLILTNASLVMPRSQLNVMLSKAKTNGLVTFFVVDLI